MSHAPSFGAADALLRGFVDQQSFPGATAVVADANGPLHSVAVGSLDYAGSSAAMVSRIISAMSTAS